MHIAKKYLQRSSPLRCARAGTHHRIKHHQVSLRFWNGGLESDWTHLSSKWDVEFRISIWRFFGVNQFRNLVSWTAKSYQDLFRKEMCTGSLLIHITYIVHHLKKLFSWFMYDSHLLSTRWMILGRVRSPALTRSSSKSIRACCQRPAESQALMLAPKTTGFNGDLSHLQRWRWVPSS